MKARRVISNRTRPVPPIEPVTRRFRSLHPTRRRWGSPSRYLVDGYVTITVARVRWAERPMP